MRHAARLLAILCALLPAAGANAATTAEIAQETLRSHQVGRRVINAWWLPVEYWEAAAQELHRPAEEVAQVRKLLANYLVLAFLDANFDDRHKPKLVEHGELLPRMQLVRNGEVIGPLRQLDPELSRRMPDLSYFLTVSLGPLGPGVRLLFFSNVDDAGKVALGGGGPGELELRYRMGEREEPLHLVWRSPLTSVVGPHRCPKGGEPLEASWSYCPWHGVPVGASPTRADDARR